MGRAIKNRWTDEEEFDDEDRADLRVRPDPQAADKYRVRRKKKKDKRAKAVSWMEQDD